MAIAIVTIRDDEGSLDISADFEPKFGEGTDSPAQWAAFAAIKYIAELAGGNKAIEELKLDGEAVDPRE